MTLDLDGASFNRARNLCQLKNFLVPQKALMLRRHMRKKLDAPIPSWATSQQDIENVGPPLSKLINVYDSLYEFVYYKYNNIDKIYRILEIYYIKKGNDIKLYNNDYDIKFFY